MAITLALSRIPSVLRICPLIEGQERPIVRQTPPHSHQSAPSMPSLNVHPRDRLMSTLQHTIAESSLAWVCSELISCCDQH